jgi:hypothetical protein
MSKTYKSLMNDINNYLIDLDIENSVYNILHIYKKKIKKEYIEQKYKLLLKISEDENLNFNDLKKKYLTSKELAILENNTVTNNEENEVILNKIEIDNNTYYYEQKENGKIYDKFSLHIGYYKNNEFIFQT